MLVSTRLVECVFRLCVLLRCVVCSVWLGWSLVWLAPLPSSVCGSATSTSPAPLAARFPHLPSPPLVLLSSRGPCRPVHTRRRGQRQAKAGRQADRQAAGGDHHEEQEQTNSNEAAGKRTSGTTTNQTTHKHTHTDKRTNKQTDIPACLPRILPGVRSRRVYMRYCIRRIRIPISSPMQPSYRQGRKRKGRDIRERTKK